MCVEKLLPGPLNFVDCMNVISLVIPKHRLVIIPKNHFFFIVSPTHIRNSPYTIPILKNFFFVRHRLHECYSLVMVLFSFLLSQEMNLFNEHTFFRNTFLHNDLINGVYFFSPPEWFFGPVLLMHHQIHTDLSFHCENAQIIVSSICTHY